VSREPLVHGPWSAHVRGTHLMCQVQGSASSADPANRSLLVTFLREHPVISIILGPDYALAHQRLKEVRQQRDPSGDSTSFLDGKSISIRQVIMDISSIGFFSAGRVVIVEDLIVRLGKQGARDGGNTPDWPALFAAVQPDSTLILIDTSLGSVPAMVKKALPKDANVDISKPPRGPQLIGWIQRAAKYNGSEIDQAAARELAMSLYPQSWAQEPRNPAYDRPPDMELLGNEIAKLALAAHPGPITQRHLRELVARESDDKLFTFLDAASAGNIAVAVVELEKLLDAGEDPAKLLAQLGQNVELGSVMSAAGRRNPADVGKEIGLANPNRMASIQRGLQGQSMSSALRRVPLATDADRKMKTGALREPLDALYDVMLSIAARRRAR
jgi:DNA polymerase III delta subunit